MKFICPFCRALLSVENNDLGIDVQCGQCGEISKSPLSLISTNVVIGNDFVILEELGRGGMGVVYLSHQISLDRPAALKVLSKKYADNNDFVAGFIKEARAAAKLNHPNIVQAYAVGEDSGIYYFAMEYIEGETMKDVLKKVGKIPVDQACEIVRQIADALDFAWKEQRLIHRDIKPDNIMIISKNQRAKLADLGLARVAGEIDTTQDEVMGTPQYISPEALTGSPMDVRSDIYSLGATFYHFLTGSFPFTGRNALEIAKKHLQEPLQDPRTLNSAIPESIAQIVMKMMEKSPDDRYQTAESLVEDLRISKRGGKVSASSSSSRKGKIVFHTSQLKGITPTSPLPTLSTTSTQGIGSSTSTGSSKFNISTRTGSGKINTAAMRLEQEEKARRQFIAMIILCVLVLVAAVVYTYWKQSKKNRDHVNLPSKQPIVKTPTQNVIIQKPSQSSEEPDSTEYTEAVTKILDFAKEHPELKSDILSKIEKFLTDYPNPKFKCERSALKALLSIYIPLDEKYRLSEARQRERDSYLAQIQKRKDEERLKELQLLERKKIEEKEKELARLQKEREEEVKKKLEEYSKKIEDKKNEDRFKALKESIDNNNMKGAIDIFEKAEKEPDIVEVEFKETAREYAKWAQIQKERVQKAIVFYDKICNIQDDTIKTNIEIVPGILGKVVKIHQGVVFAETLTGRVVKNEIFKLPSSQYRKLIQKLSINDNEAAFTLTLFFGIFDILETMNASKDLKDEANLFIKAYIGGKYKEALSKSAKERDLMINEIKKKYGYLPQYKDAIQELE